MLNHKKSNKNCCSPDDSILKGSITTSTKSAPVTSKPPKMRTANNAKGTSKEVVNSFRFSNQTIKISKTNISTNPTTEKTNKNHMILNEDYVTDMYSNIRTVLNQKNVDDKGRIKSTGSFNEGNEIRGIHLASNETESFEKDKTLEDVRIY